MIFMGAFFPLHFVGTPYPQSDIQNELWERTMSLSINTCYKSTKLHPNKPNNDWQSTISGPCSLTDSTVFIL